MSQEATNPHQDILATAGSASAWSFVETGRQLELQLAKLQRQLASQEVNIAAVDSKLDAFVSKDAFERTNSVLDMRLERIEAALAELKQQCHIPNHSGTSIGEAVASNMSSITNLQDQVSKRATIESMETVTTEIRQDLASQAAHLDEVKASKAFVNSYVVVSLLWRMQHACSYTQIKRHNQTSCRAAQYSGRHAFTKS